ncbi:TPA: hypothetical protein EYP84_01415 [Candidatus Bipolaricaulota bacterium]|nr:hypothetical protein [Candidatus Bipolaricaulota bacterium]
MDGLKRYSRQTLLPEIGSTGQRQLLASSVAVVGCGALGTVIASTLVRAGGTDARVRDGGGCCSHRGRRLASGDSRTVAEIGR